MSEFEVLVQLYEITEMRDGCVYKTKLLGNRWMDMDERDAGAPEGFIYASPPLDPDLIAIRRKGA
jgi:hypothetical protein